MDVNTFIEYLEYLKENDIKRYKNYITMDPKFQFNENPIEKNSTILNNNKIYYSRAFFDINGGVFSFKFDPQKHSPNALFLANIYIEENLQICVLAFPPTSAFEKNAAGKYKNVNNISFNNNDIAECINNGYTLGISKGKRLAFYFKRKYLAEIISEISARTIDYEGAKYYGDVEELYKHLYDYMRGRDEY